MVPTLVSVPSPSSIRQLNLCITTTKRARLKLNHLSTPYAFKLKRRHHHITVFIIPVMNLTIRTPKLLGIADPCQ
jgi:hypothetical protein